MRDTYQEIIYCIDHLPNITPEVKRQLDECRKVLYELDKEGKIAGKSKIYIDYLKNAEAYAQAKANYAQAQAAPLADPTPADNLSVKSTLFHKKLDDAFRRLNTTEAAQVEQALETLKSVGVSYLVRHNLYPLRLLE